jgi:hypothetical protein
MRIQQRDVDSPHCGKLDRHRPQTGGVDVVRLHAILDLSIGYESGSGFDELNCHPLPIACQDRSTRRELNL